MDYDHLKGSAKSAFSTAAPQTKFVQERQPAITDVLEIGPAREITPEQDRKEIDERTAEFRKQWIRRMHSH